MATVERQNGKKGNMARKAVGNGSDGAVADRVDMRVKLQRWVVCGDCARLK